MIDSYGFTFSDDEDIKTYEDFVSKYHHVLDHRSSRWSSLLSSSMPDKDSRKLKRFIRKGIPWQHRPQMWMCLSGAERRMQENKGLYQALLSEQHDPLQVDTITKDIHRTFPDNIYFRGDEVFKQTKHQTEGVSEEVKEGEKKESEREIEREVKETKIKDSIGDVSHGDSERVNEGDGQKEGEELKKDITADANREAETKTDTKADMQTDKQSDESKRGALYNVLLAISHKNKQTGYCQGMNFVTGLLLLVVKDEEKVFWLVDTLINEILPDYYSPDMLGVKVDCDVLDQLVKMKCPEVHALAESMGCVWPLVATKWFICLFVDVLPTETVLRLWDCLFLEGDKILFRVCVTLIKRSSSSILQSGHFGQLMEAMKAMTKDPIVLDCHSFIELIFKDPGSFPKSLISRLRQECRKKNQNGAL